MKKLLLGLSLLLVGGSHVFGLDTQEDAYKKVVKEVVKLPKVELCHIQSYIKNDTKKLDTYIKALSSNQHMIAKVKTLKDIRNAIDEWTFSEDDIERLKSSALNGVIDNTIKNNKWTPCSR